MHKPVTPGQRWAPLLAGLVLGAALQLRQAELWAAWAYAGLLAGGALAAVALRSVRSHGVAFVAAAAMAFALAGWRAAVFAADALPPDIEGRNLQVTGVVSSLPQAGELGVRFRFEVEAAREAGGGEVRIPPALSLAWGTGAWAAGSGPFELQRAAGDVRAGERWRFAVRLRAPHGNLNPDGFDYELWLWEQGLQATGYVRSGPNDPPPQRLGATWNAPIAQARQQVREAIVARIADRQAAGIVAALVVGDQNAIDRADWDVFRATGVAHLMSISGLHVTMFAWLAAALVGAGWRRSARLCLAVPAPQAAVVGGVALATAYALFSGWGVPAQRTLLMLASIAWLRLSGRRWPWPVSWLFACAVVVTADPWSLLQAGFWLSFVAVGVLFATDAGAAPVGWVQRGTRLLREQAVVTVALAPLTLLLFGQVSVVGLAANLAAIPWVTLVVTPLAMAGVAWPPVWDLASLAVQGLTWMLQALAAMPWAVWVAPTPPLWAAATGLAGGLLLAMRLPWPVRSLGVPLLLPVLLWQLPRPAPGEFDLLAADIGQGNAVLVRTATHALLYDTGPRLSPDSDAGQRVLVPLLRSIGERLDRVVVSHRDSDHTGGAASVLAAQPSAALEGSLESSHPLRAIRGMQACLAGRRWSWDGVDFEYLHPTAADVAAATRPNAVSCVLRISNARRSVLLTGDIEQPQEAALLARGTLAPVDVLLVPHHGSKTSSSEAFLDAVRPHWALVQAGWRNRFGHPAPVVVERYAARQVQLVDSPHCGAAGWSSADPDHVRCEREVSRRYWHHLLPPPDP
ncbi:DNA internalization-related competence protein ComEC/Rec2 [Ramlibacter humi]|uniref:DNA internalization-related competence protein ComEC/Rec2 n=1 Tax=Ramlibacter humi TaxID=2530451 RepID=A0A4Z0CDC5_9BURK|nr:DNA internalization-related competence protein ComEC/Rec2 [Ramlibacter humi]TFZ08982.1 DNA internalization-related competence protein ComEC/Rec2 [Ramlibacter humi]